MGDGTHLNRDAILDLLTTEQRYRENVADYLLAHRACAGPSEPVPTVDREDAAQSVMQRIDRRLNEHEYDTTPWDKGYRVGLRDALEDFARAGFSIVRTHGTDA